MRASAFLPSALVCLSWALLAHAGDARLTPERVIDPGQWRVVERDSGPDDYYVVVRDPSMPFIRSRYRPPEKTTVLGYQVPDDERSKVRAVRWKWRALTLPRGGNECADGKHDSAAVVYLTWRSGLRFYTLKYVWSSVGPKGATCDRKRNPFVAQDTTILETGGPLDVWTSEGIDLGGEFRAHFEDGRANADVPPFVGLGIMSDGDQTASESAADFAGFVLSY
jgi:hypothetical protein